MTRHLGLKFTAKSSAILDICLDIAREQAPLATVSLPSFFMGLLERHARELGLRVIADDDGKLVRILRTVIVGEPSGLQRKQEIQVWPKEKPFEIIKGALHKKDAESR
jgi:hypothetical protein